MARRITFALVAALVVAVPALALEGERHSGRVAEIRPDGKLVIEEMGPWNGPGTGLMRRTLDLAPDTTVREVRPKVTWDSNDVMPGYDVRPADRTQIKPGDFVTAITNGDQQPVAVALDVVRPEPGDGGLASPQSGPRR
jgi:hypothetical protein